MTTKGYGTGVDLVAPAIRLVIHYGVCDSMTLFVQQVMSSLLLRVVVCQISRRDHHSLPTIFAATSGARILQSTSHRFFVFVLLGGFRESFVTGRSAVQHATVRAHEQLCSLTGPT